VSNTRSFATVLAGIRAGGFVFAAFPGAPLRSAFQWLVEGETGFREIRPLTVAGAAQVGFALCFASRPASR